MPNLGSIPNEILCFIFEALDDRVSSVCLGISNRNLYAVHWRLHGKVEWSEETNMIFQSYTMGEVRGEFTIRGFTCSLAYLLQNWVPATHPFAVAATKIYGRLGIRRKTWSLSGGLHAMRLWWAMRMKSFIDTAEDIMSP
jgi:hypothetical protein